MSLPTVSVVCSTYGRWWLLEEMLASFLAQDYAGHLELVVVNDAPVRLELPPWLPANRSVRLYNLDCVAPFNPWKRDFGTFAASGKWCTYYDDDDIMLPHRFTRQVARLEESGADWLASHVAAVWQDRGFVQIADNFFFCSHLWRRSLMPRAGNDCTGWDDVTAADRLRDAGAQRITITRETAVPEDVVHVYRWGGGNAHHSGIPGDRSAKAKEEEFRAACERHPNWHTGKHTLQPQLRRPYARLCSEYLAANWAAFTNRKDMQ